MTCSLAIMSIYVYVCALAHANLALLISQYELNSFCSMMQAKEGEQKEFHNFEAKQQVDISSILCTRKVGLSFRNSIMPLKRIIIVKEIEEGYCSKNQRIFTNNFSRYDLILFSFVYVPDVINQNAINLM